MAEQHNDLLMKNHEAHPARSVPLPKAHAVDAHNQSEIRQNNSVDESMRGHGKGKRRYNNHRGCDHNKRENNIGSENNPSKKRMITVIVVALKVTEKMNVRHLSILSGSNRIP